MAAGSARGLSTAAGGVPVKPRGRWLSAAAAGGLLSPRRGSWPALAAVPAAPLAVTAWAVPGSTTVTLSRRRTCPASGVAGRPGLRSHGQQPAADRAAAGDRRAPSWPASAPAATSSRAWTRAPTTSAYLNPLTGKIEGFDIDMVHAVAKAIFGNPNKVEFKAISDAQRIPEVQSGAVNIVAHTMTINCARLQQVDFSTVYYDAGQRVLVEATRRSRASRISAGRRCARPPAPPPSPTSGRALAPDPGPGARTGPTAWCCCSRVRRRRDLHR